MKDIKADLRDVIKNRLGLDTTSGFKQLMRDAYFDSDVQSFIKQHQLSNEVVKRSAAKIYEFVQQKRKVDSHQNGLIPGYQPRLVMSGDYIDVSYEPTNATLVKQRNRTMKNRIRSISMPKEVRDASLANFELDRHDRKEVVEHAVNFIDNYTQNHDHYVQAMYIYGKFGVGKTFLLGAIANELAKKNVATTMVHFPSFAKEMKDSISDHTGAAKLDSIKKAQVLMLDDIGADTMSNWIRDEVLGIILEYRMQNELPTFFSSNYSMAEFELSYLMSDKNNQGDTMKAKRLMQRIRFLAKEYLMEGPNRRPQ